DPEEIQKFFMGSSKTEPISYMGNSTVSAGALNIQAGDLTINGFLTGNFSDRVGVAQVLVNCGNQIINTNNSNSSALQNANVIV
ncbi:hypothetical protein, partial [Campylobacter concisus]|uniref:hypothetical protein n=1 Tax=Campylobacter concisus TaxID=199 RepID=UPI003D2EDE50